MKNFKSFFALLLLTATAFATDLRKSPTVAYRVPSLSKEAGEAYLNQKAGEDPRYESFSTLLDKPLCYGFIVSPNYDNEASDAANEVLRNIFLGKATKFKLLSDNSTEFQLPNVEKTLVRVRVEFYLVETDKLVRPDEKTQKKLIEMWRRHLNQLIKSYAATSK